MAYKILFTDMDGTLLQNDTQVSPENKEAIAKAVAKGVQVVLCTGRGIYGIVRILENLDLKGKKGYVVSQNGGAVYHLEDLSLAWKRGFSPKDLAPYVSMAEDLGLEMYYYDNWKFLAKTVTPQVEKYCEVMGTEAVLLDDVGAYEGEMTKCLICGDHEKLLLVQKRIMEEKGMELTTFFSNDRYMEVVKLGVNKGDSLKRVIELLEIPVSEAIAIGDSENDLSMIREAGLGVAVVNAPQYIQEQADYVTEKTYLEHAVAEVIEKFIL